MKTSILRILGVIVLVLAFSVEALSPAGAQANLDIPISNETEREAVFVPLRLIAPDCNYGGLIKSVEAVDRYSVVFNLCRSDAAFLTRIATPSFAIYPQEWIEATTGYSTRTTEGLEHPIGTGPYMVGSWSRGDNITFVKNPDYWGTAPLTDTLIFRWSDQPGDRLLALQSGAIDGFDDVSPADYATIEADPNLQLVVRDGLNTFYIGMNNTFTPFDDVRVRQAVAMGIDRQHIIDVFYRAGSALPTHFTPCSIPNGCVGTDWYDFDVNTARDLLTDAGYADGFQTHLYYRNVYRVYLPDPVGIAQEIHDQLLANLNIDAEIVEMESGLFLEEVRAGHLDGFYLLGWGVDYPHVSNFLDYHFGQGNIQFGTSHPEIYAELTEAAQYANPLTAQPFYTDANNAIRELVPMVPVAHAASAAAYLAEVANPQASPFAVDLFKTTNPGGRNEFKWMQNAEPYSLFCADEWDNDSFRACVQVMEPLYNLMLNSASIEPALAESCTPNGDATVYFCTLRQNVLFHDGTSFDANDVVETFAMGLDISSPYHKGNTNSWDYYNGTIGLMDTAVHTISGNVGAGNAVLNYVDAGNRTAIADINGDYSFMVSDTWSGTVTPSKPGYTFAPSSRTYTNVTSDMSAQNYYIAQSGSYRSVGTQDGWILESTEISNAGGTMNATATTFNLGDGTADKQYRSILSFNTASLPDTAVITKVTLKIRVYGALVGNNNPFTWGQGLKVDVCKGTFGTSALQLADFNFNNATNCRLLAGTFGSTPTSGWYSVNLISAARSKVNPLGLTQFRLRFYKDDNDDNAADYWRFYSGNYATASLRPTLIIEYYVP